jgi:hypothetical protein
VCGGMGVCGGVGGVVVWRMCGCVCGGLGGVMCLRVGWVGGGVCGEWFSGGSASRRHRGG